MRKTLLGIVLLICCAALFFLEVFADTYSIVTSTGPGAADPLVKKFNAQGIPFDGFGGMEDHGYGEIDIATGRLFDTPSNAEQIVVSTTWAPTGTVDVTVFDGVGNDLDYYSLQGFHQALGVEDLISMATGDTDGDGYDELIFAQAHWEVGAPWNIFASTVMVFDGTNYPISNFAVYWSSYSMARFSVAAGDIDNDGVDEIVIANGENTLGSDYYKVFVKAYEQDGTWLGEFIAYEGDWAQGGATVTVGNLDTSPEEEIIVVPGYTNTGNTIAKVFQWDPGLGPPNGTGMELPALLFNIDQTRSFGVDATVHDFDDDNKNEVVISEFQGVGLQSLVAGLHTDEVDPVPIFQAFNSTDNQNGQVHVAVLKEYPPAITSFTADPAVIAPGGSSTLEWETDNADSGSIDNGIGPVGKSGTEIVSPGETTTYELTAINLAGLNTPGSVTVQVVPPPTVSIAADPNPIYQNQSSTLTWVSTDADTAEIDNGIGPVNVNGDHSVSPSETTTYKIIVANEIDYDDDEVIVEVIPPPIVTFSASEETIYLGGSSTLNWDSSYGVTAEIDPVLGSVELNGTDEVWPTETTTYTLTVTNPAGTAEKEVTITVIGAPTITSFYADPQTIYSSQSSNLVWASADGVSASLDPEFGSVELNGIRSVSPTETTDYTLTVENPVEPVQSVVTIEVIPPPTVTISADPTTIYNGEPSTLTWQSTDAETANIQPEIGDVELNDSTLVYPNENTTYEITVSSPAGNASMQVDVEVLEVIDLPSYDPYGNITSGDQSHPNEVAYSFSGTSGDVILTYQVWDADTESEIEIYLNGLKINDAGTSTNEEWSETKEVLLADSDVLDDQKNILIFNHSANPPDTELWGVRAVGVQTMFYNELGQLIRVEILSGTTGGPDVEYEYDEDGNRILRSVVEQ